MTYDAIETSVYSGDPVELYTFARGSTEWLYTSCDENITIGLKTYQAVAISRSSVEQTQDIGRNPVTLKCSRNLPFALQYISESPTDSVSLTIKRFHATDVDEQVVVVWIGRVVNVKFDGNSVSMKCEPIFTSLKRPVLRRMYQVSCPHLLYGSQCGAAKASFEESISLSNVVGTSLTSGGFSAFPDGYFTGGTVEWDNGSNITKRFVLSHTGATVVINIPILGITDTSEVKAYPGCDHSVSTCLNKFDNLDNYGGQPYIPSKNPFSGNSVF